MYARLRQGLDEFGWTVHAANGRKLATSGEFYKRRSHTIKMVRLLFPALPLRDEHNKEIPRW
jgi:hypothetical protein